MTHPNQPASGLDRRTVVRGAAWTVPAVAVASAAPAFASSADQVSLSLVSQQWDANYLYVQLKVSNLSDTATASNVAVTLLFQGAWKDGAAIDLDPYEGGVNGSWGEGWTAGSTTQTVISATATRVITLAQLGPNGESILGFRVRRQGLSSRTPYETPVGTSITSAGPGFTVASDSITGFISAPEFVVTEGIDLRLTGACGALGLLGPGFTLTAGTTDVPAGTTITVTRRGVAAVNVLPVVADSSGAQVPGLANVNLIGDGNYAVTLSQPLAAGGSLHVRYVLSLNVLAQESGVVAAPAGHTIATSSKTTGEFNATLVLCTSS